MQKDSARLGEHPIVRKLRETMHRWWGLTLSVAGAGGAGVEEGIVIPEGNLLCTSCLADGEGRRRCNESIGEALRRLREPAPGEGSAPPGEGAPGQWGAPRARLLGPCHMGLGIAAASVELGGAEQGVLFTCGFLAQEGTEAARETALGEVAALRLPVVQPDAAFAAVPRIEARELDRFTDLLAATVEQIAGVEETALDREREIQSLRRELSGRCGFAELVGKSEPMRRLDRLLDTAVAGGEPVLLSGERGSGKSLVARVLHRAGPRSAFAFIVQDCGALGDALFERELFGQRRGASSPGARDKAGLLPQAQGGTLFLDEVADLAPGLQVKVLRLLQEGTYVPIGGAEALRADVRVIAATSKDLRELVARQLFREDLFWRLQALRIELPPLRSRLEDLPLLVEHFLEAHARRTERPRKQLHPEVLASFYQRPWPGNVRELEDEIERLLILAGDAALVPKELSRRHAAPPAPAAKGPAVAELRATSSSFFGSQPGDGAEVVGGLAKAVAALERELIQTSLLALQGNRSRLAERLGVSRTTLLKKIRDYGIRDPRGAPAATEGDA